MASMRNANSFATHVRDLVGSEVSTIARGGSSAAPSDGGRRATSRLGLPAGPPFIHGFEPNSNGLRGSGRPPHWPRTAPAADCRSRAGTGRHNVAMITKHAVFEFEVGPSQRGCS